MTKDQIAELVELRNVEAQRAMADRARVLIGEIQQAQNQLELCKRQIGERIDSARAQIKALSHTPITVVDILGE